MRVTIGNSLTMTVAKQKSGTLSKALYPKKLEVFEVYLLIWKAGWR